MCLDHFSVLGWILRNSMADAERAMPGKGCELITAFSAVGDMALIAGFFVGVAAVVLLQGAIGSVHRSRRYLDWKEAQRYAD